MAYFLSSKILMYVSPHCYSLLAHEDQKILLLFVFME